MNYPAAELRGINPKIGKLIPTQRVGVLTNLGINHLNIMEMHYCFLDNKEITYVLKSIVII